MKHLFNYKNFKEALNEAQIPSNIRKFAKERGVLRDVQQIARWAEKAGERIVGGTAIGRGYDTLVLDLTYDGSEIYFDTDEGTIEVNGQPVDSWESFSKALNESLNEGKSITAIQKEWAKTTTKMKELAQRFKAAEGDAKTKILNELKALTKRKKELERDLDDAVMSKGINQELSAIDEAVNLKRDHLSSDEYQKAKKLKGFNHDDWKWNSDTDLYDKVDKANELALEGKEAEGQMAAVKGKKYEENPYKKGTKDHLEWSKGHNQARASKLSMK